MAAIYNLKIDYYKSFSNGSRFFNGTASLVLEDSNLCCSIRIPSVYGSSVQEMRNHLRLVLEDICVKRVLSDKEAFEVLSSLQAICDQCKLREVSEDRFWSLKSQEPFSAAKRFNEFKY